jgi:SpoVK/Ycf46/Vps4 family AAA+-type ATPase
MELAGINASSSLLLYGPPGCGKSCLARYIASELGYKLVIGRLDGLISSYVGNTAKNISSIFEFASNIPCVLFLDELDAIAKLRDDTQEIGELKRVVNSFLQNLDSLGPQTIVIAATNHPQLLDAAVWRRFSYRLELNYPTYDMRVDLWTNFLKDKITFSKNEINVLSDISEGFSGSDIKEICLKLFRYRFVNKKEVLLNDAYSYIYKFIQGNKELYPVLNLISAFEEKQKKAKALKQRNEKLYTSSILAALLDTSRATASRWAKESE